MSWLGRLYRLRFYWLAWAFVILLLYKIGIHPLPLHPINTPVLLYSHSFPANHQLSFEDININGLDTNRQSVHDSLYRFIGQHLTNVHLAGEVVESGDLSRQLQLPTPGKDSLIFMLTVSATEEPFLRLLDAGDCIGLADVPHPFQPNSHILRILATHLSTTAAPGNWMLLEEATRDADGNENRIESPTRKIFLVNKGAPGGAKIRQM